MSCLRCSDICVRYLIGSLSELSEAIKIVFQDMQDGTIRKVVSPKNGSGPTLIELVQGATWNDVVSFGFKGQTCGQPFRLHAETYHGPGEYCESVEIVLSAD